MTLDGSIKLISLTSRFVFYPMSQINLPAYWSAHSRPGIVTCILAAALCFAPLRALGQCQPISASTKTQPPVAVPQKSQSGQPEFFDEPQFTVAGVTEIGRASCRERGE